MSGWKRKILYLMHVDWNWIKQRPHFIAEGLARRFDVVVAYCHSFRRGILTENHSDISKIAIYRLPFRNRLVGGSLVDRLGLTFQVKRLISEYKPDTIYVTSPEFYCAVKDVEVDIVYDCMDDFSEFFSADRRKRDVLNEERELVRKCSRVIVTSSGLLNKMEAFGARDKTVLIRNGSGFSKVVPAKTRFGFQERWKLVYFGTIANWMDFDLIKYSLDQCPWIDYLFIGPIEPGLNIPLSDRIVFQGPVSHDKLRATVSGVADCLVMPFKPTQLILSVDPVKLYEYISFSLPIVTIDYSGIGYFKNFVVSYRSPHEFVTRLNELAASNFAPTYTLEQAQDFLLQNTWEKRGEEIASILTSM